MLLFCLFSPLHTSISSFFFSFFLPFSLVTGPYGIFFLLFPFVCQLLDSFVLRSSPIFFFIGIFHPGQRRHCNITPPSAPTHTFITLLTIRFFLAGDQLVVPRGVTHISCHYKNTIEGVGEKENKRTNRTNDMLGVNQEQKELCNTTLPIAYMD